MIQPPLFYLSHHRCATMYANSILGRVCAELGRTRRTYFGPDDFQGDLRRVTERQRVDLIRYLDAEWEHARDLVDVRGVHVIRDPGYWRNHLGPTHLEELQRRFPELLDETGYREAGPSDAARSH